MDIGSLGEAVGGAVTFLGGAYAAFKRLQGNSKRRKEEYRALILKQAKEEADKVKEELENKINKLGTEVEEFKNSVSKDLSNLKENHALELKNLGDKIELLREELRSQSTGILALLTKLVDK